MFSENRCPLFGIMLSAAQSPARRDGVIAARHSYRTQSGPTHTIGGGATITGAGATSTGAGGG